MDASPDSLQHPVSLQELDRNRRRKVLVIAAVRLTAVLTLVLTVYFLLPVEGFNQDNSAAAWVRITGIGLTFLIAMALQVRIVVSAHVPQVRAAEAVVESIFLFLCLFSLLYISISETDPASFTEPLTRLDAFYLTTATFATVGFGDITPTSDVARTVVIIQMIVGLGVLVLIAKVSFFAARQSLRGVPQKMVKHRTQVREAQ